MKILIAEDDVVSRRLLESVLNKLGYEVISTENGRDAWTTFLVETPRILITDWMMPFVDGPELCRKVRGDQRFRYTYIIMLTALAGRKFYLEGMNAGADDFLNKPFDMEELSVRLKAAERILDLQAEVSILNGLLPTCSYCKSIRDEKNEWQPLEQFVASRTSTSFSHTLCPECTAKAAGKTSPRQEAAA
ncbi:MAG: response regulator receiver protein [Bacteroidetes bacterium]|nr:response regulator receiver protein [Bacteroidota bacterium]